MVLYLNNALPLINLDSITDILSVMMSKNFFHIAGEGAMGISCSIGANTLAILLCLGMPWFVKCMVLIIQTEDTSKRNVNIMSEGITYNCGAILISVMLLLLVLAIFRFQIGKRLGFISLIMYIIIISFCVLIEMNVFFIVNKPLCDEL
jgi:Ca2+/Na+ antiporter